MGASDDLLFVYGSLRRGSDHANALRLAQESTWLGTGSLVGTLYTVSWHPALLLDGTGRVIGDLVRLRDPASSWPWLDAFESCAPSSPMPHEYRRETVSVHVHDKDWQAICYIWNLSVEGLAPVTSGDWLQR